MALVNVVMCQLVWYGFGICVGLNQCCMTSVGDMFAVGAA